MDAAIRIDPDHQRPIHLRAVCVNYSHFLPQTRPQAVWRVAGKSGLQLTCNSNYGRYGCQVKRFTANLLLYLSMLSLSTGIT